MGFVRLQGPGVITELNFDGPAVSTAGSSLVVAQHCGRLLMIYSKVRQGWEFPGGKAIVGEEAEACARREFREETGLSLTGLTSLCSFQVTKIGMLHTGVIFTGSISDYSPNLNSSEILGIGLFSKPPSGVSLKDGYVELMFKKLLGVQR